MFTLRSIMLLAIACSFASHDLQADQLKAPYSTLEWSSTLEPSAKHIRAEIFIISPLGTLGGPFVEVFEQQQPKERHLLKVRFSNEGKTTHLYIALDKMSSSTNGLPKSLYMRSNFSLPPILGPGDYILSSNKPKSFYPSPPLLPKDAPGGILLRITAQ